MGKKSILDVTGPLPALRYQTAGLVRHKVSLSHHQLSANTNMRVTWRGEGLSMAAVEITPLQKQHYLSILSGPRVSMAAARRVWVGGS